MTAQPFNAVKRANLAGLGVLLLCAILWSLNGPLIKLVNRDGQGVPGVAIACYRSLIGGLVLLPFLIRHRRSLVGVPSRWVIGSVTCFTVMTACFVIATTMTQAANAIVLQYTSPIWVFLLSPLLLKERAAGGDFLCLLIAMVGVAVIFAGNWSGGSLGLIVALGAGLGYGALTVTLRGLRSVNPLVVAAINALCSGLILLPWVAVSSPLMYSARDMWLIVLMSLVQFVGPYVLFSWALNRVQAHRASLIVLLETVLNPLWTYLAVGERVPIPTLMGGPLIVGSVALLVLLRVRRARAAEVGVTERDPA